LTDKRPCSGRCTAKTGGFGIGSCFSPDLGLDRVLVEEVVLIELEIEAFPE
jgi:hypothetical protein